MSEMVDAKAYRWANERIRELEADVERMREGLMETKRCLDLIGHVPRHRRIEAALDEIWRALNPEQGK